MEIYIACCSSIVMVYGMYVSVQATDVADICELQPCHKFVVLVCMLMVYVSRKQIR